MLCCVVYAVLVGIHQFHLLLQNRSPSLPYRLPPAPSSIRHQHHQQCIIFTKTTKFLFSLLFSFFSPNDFNILTRKITTKITEYKWTFWSIFFGFQATQKKTKSYSETKTKQCSMWSDYPKKMMLFEFGIQH